MDIETITRQDAEIIDLRRDNGLLQSELNSVKEDNTNLRATVRRLERRLVKLEDISPQLEELLRKRLEEADDHH